MEVQQRVMHESKLLVIEGGGKKQSRRRKRKRGEEICQEEEKEKGGKKSVKKKHFCRHPWKQDAGPRRDHCESLTLFRKENQKFEFV